MGHVVGRVVCTSRSSEDWLRGRIAWAGGRRTTSRPRRHGTLSWTCTYSHALERKGSHAACRALCVAKGTGRSASRPLGNVVTAHDVQSQGVSFFPFLHSSSFTRRGSTSITMRLPVLPPTSSSVKSSTPPSGVWMETFS